jgi:long-subunit acyl-CoA synthetase (AMP-forming)
VRYYGDKTCFQVIDGNQLRKFTYQGIWNQIIQIGQALCAIESISDKNTTIGIFTENSIRGALIDLACLSFHIPIVPIPVTTTPDHLAFIIENSTITQLFIGELSVQAILRESNVEQKSLDIYHLDDPAEAIIFAKSWESFISQAVDFDDINVLKRINQCTMNDLATVMYTSGTTDEPKGIIFTQENIVTKRFARALALPDFSCDDIFLCFLPLYHTFGRYFELLGSIFWGATYTFAESPYFKSLLKDFQLTKPTIFISVPKRWIQLMEHTDSIKSVGHGEDQEIKNIVNQITGGNLKYGLSAAGYLDPDVFRFFQGNGINLLSGYGMTEATGGITMTPTDDYQPDSVGVPLPGIKLALGDDGELLINGPYVSSSYFGKQNYSSLVNGWFHTGDIFNKKHDHYYIIDRKKEIYKNSRGQTISPQKIENMFQDFDGIKSAFLVGDGLEFNTLLIHPDSDSLPMDISNASLVTIREYYSSLIQSVNSFLTPFERVINYAIIKRDFNSDEELTQKGTYKRKQILKNFREIINPMYQKNHITLSYKNYQVHIPNWLLREKGVSRNDVKWNGSKISIKNNKISLKLSWENSRLVIGDFTYHTREDSLDLQELLLSPELWLGNNTFADFIGKSAFRLTKFEPIKNLQLAFPSMIVNADKDIQNIVDSVSLPDLGDLHKATRQLYAGHLSGFIPFNYLLASNYGDLTRIAFNILLSFRNHSDPSFRMKAMEAMLPELSGELFFELLSGAHQRHYKDKSKNGFTVNVELLKDNHFEAILSKLDQFRKDIDSIIKEQFSFIQILLPIVANYGLQHPTKYIWARSELYWWQISDCPDFL